MNTNDLQQRADQPRRAVLRRLWGRMATLYGRPWISVNGVSPERAPGQDLTLAGDTWSRALAGIDEMAIAKALGTCMIGGSEWPPKPGEFRAMCLEIPSFDEVADQLIARRTDVSRFGRKVWEFIRDPYEFRTAAAPRQEAILRGAYSQARTWAMAGKPLPPEPVAEVEHVPQPKRFLPTDQVLTMLHELQERL